MEKSNPIQIVIHYMLICCDIFCGLLETYLPVIKHSNWPSPIQFKDLPNKKNPLTVDLPFDCRRVTHQIDPNMGMKHDESRPETRLNWIKLGEG